MNCTSSGCACTCPYWPMLRSELRKCFQGLYYSREHTRKEVPALWKKILMVASTDLFCLLCISCNDSQGLPMSGLPSAWRSHSAGIIVAVRKEDTSFLFGHMYSSEEETLHLIFQKNSRVTTSAYILIPPNFFFPSGLVQHVPFNFVMEKGFVIWIHAPCR